MLYADELHSRYISFISSLPCVSDSFFILGVYRSLMSFSTSFMCSSFAFLFGSVCRYSYVSSSITLASLAIGNTFFTLYTSREYCCLSLAFLKVFCGNTYTLFVCTYIIESPSHAALPIFTIGTNVGLSMSTSLSSGSVPCLFCAMAVQHRQIRVVVKNGRICISSAKV